MSRDVLLTQVRHWLGRLLAERFPLSRATTGFAKRRPLSRWLETAGLADAFGQHVTFDVRIDVVGVALEDGTARLALVQCKLRRIVLRDVFHATGSGRVCQPWRSIIVSPAGVSRPVAELFNTYQRYDVLQYGPGIEDKVIIATWDKQRQSIVSGSVIPPGFHP